MTVPVFEDRPETVRGRMLYQSLLVVHALIRRDLTTVERLAAAARTAFLQKTCTRSSGS